MFVRPAVQGRVSFVCLEVVHYPMSLIASGHPSLTLPLGSLDNDLCPPPLRAVQTTASATVNTRVCGDRYVVGTLVIKTEDTSSSLHVCY